MQAWNGGLWAELFDDPSGDGRPVSIINIDDALFSRAIAKQGFNLSETEARRAFLDAFPSRLTVQRWLTGSENPGDALLPLLVLCCLAASDAADSDNNDYRARMRDMMGWSDRIINCEALPQLWSRLRTQTMKRGERVTTRPLVLPDPRFRTQIGHAIELTFPSRNDTRRLVQELSGQNFDLDSPRAVLAWLTPLVAKGRFSSTFEETFNSFRDAWLAAERALVDHRFWSGWKLATNSFRETVRIDPFEVVSDEWGMRHLVAPATEEAVELETVLRGRKVATAGLASAAAKTHVIPLIEAEWGKLRWIGGDRSRTPSAFLIRQRAFGSRYATLDCVTVSGADGWGLTFDVQGVVGDSGPSPDRDRLLDVTPTSCTRVDGGVLARPALPFCIETTGLVSSISLIGEAADRLEVSKIDARSWLVSPTEPIEGEIRIIAEPRGGGANLERTLRLRRSILAPSFHQETPDRLFDPDPEPRPGWPCTSEPGTIARRMSPGGEIAVSPALLDLIEYLAIRTAPIPLGGFVDLVRSGIADPNVNPWDVIQALRDAGVVKVLYVRGWRGRVLLSRPPRGALVRVAGGWALNFEGCTSETWTARLEAAAAQCGLAVERRSGVGAWSPSTLMMRADELSPLRDVAKSVDISPEFLSGDLKAINSIWTSIPVARSVANVQKRKTQLHGNHAPLLFLDTDRPNESPLWEVESPGGARCWKSRDDAILDAYSSFHERPFVRTADRVIAQDARLPSQLARWIRLCTGIAAGPTRDGFGYACDEVIGRELARIAPVFFGDRTPAALQSTPLYSRRWPLRAVASTKAPAAASIWSAAHEARGGK
jgi:hypothetical protein